MSAASDEKESEEYSDFYDYHQKRLATSLGDGKLHNAHFLSTDRNKLGCWENMIRREYEVKSCVVKETKREFVPEHIAWHGHGGDGDEDEPAYTRIHYRMDVCCRNPLAEFIEPEPPKVREEDSLLFLMT